MRKPMKNGIRGVLESTSNRHRENYELFDFRLIGAPIMDMKDLSEGTRYVLHGKNLPV